MISFELMPFFEISQRYLVFDSVNNLDGSQNTGWLKFGAIQGYNHMAELLVKSTQISAVKGFHINMI